MASVDKNTIEMRVRKLEQYVYAMREEAKQVLEDTYLQAVADNDEATAAQCIRKLRNHLLDGTDKDVVLDRAGLDPSTDEALRESVDEAIHNDITDYRQALRDIPEQEGFPFDVVWPINPETGTTGVFDDLDNNNSEEE